MFYDTYLSLCNKAGKTPSGAALEIGLSKPTVNRWKNGGGATDANIKKIADYFGVPVSDLTGEGQKETAHQTVSGESDLDVVLRKLPNLKPADLAIVVKAISECMETE